MFSLVLMNNKYFIIYTYTHMHEQSTNHISLYKTVLDVMQSHPLRRTRAHQQHDA